MTDRHGAAGAPPVAEERRAATRPQPDHAQRPGESRPEGLSLTFEDGTFRIHAVDAAGAALVSLGPYAEEDVVAVWRSLAAASGLPLLVRGPDGELDRPYPQIGRLVLGRSSDPRRLAVLSGRRPRFLVRRKAARLPRRPLVHREEELARGRGR